MRDVTCYASVADLYISRTSRYSRRKQHPTAKHRSRDAQKEKTYGISFVIAEKYVYLQRHRKMYHPKKLNKK